MMRGRCETHCRGIGTADLAACEHVLLERKNLILPMDANITLVQSFGPPVTKSLRARTSATTFSPEAVVSRAQAMTFLYRERT